MASLSDVRVDGDFPGGNIVVDGIDGDTISAHQDLRDTQGDWFYWCMRVRGAAGRTLTFQFTGSNPIGVRGPGASVDNDATWRWLGAACVDGAGFTYAFGPDEHDVRFSMGMPYLQSHLQTFLARHEGDRRLRAHTLCNSRKGRPVELLHVGCLDGEPAHRVLLTCRHHCCEMMASYVLEGVVDAVLADTHAGRWLSEHVEFMVVPFVDKDGVEDGDQGKNRRPRDHARDYKGEPIYPETSAIRRLVPDWSEGRLHMAVDLHCPWIRGEHNEVIYQVGSHDPEMWAQQQALGRRLEQAAVGPLPYRQADDLASGQGWNTPANYAQGSPIAPWAAQRPEVRFAGTFEIPYANAGGCEVNQNSARAFGHDLARALHLHLRDLDAD